MGIGPFSLTCSITSAITVLDTAGDQGVKWRFAAGERGNGRCWKWPITVSASPGNTSQGSLNDSTALIKATPRGQAGPGLGWRLSSMEQATTTGKSDCQVLKTKVPQSPWFSQCKGAVTVRLGQFNGTAPFLYPFFHFT